MNTIKPFLLFVCCTLIWIGCKPVSPNSDTSSASIIGSWEGCDGRIITFSNGENDQIIGRYTSLGGLAAYSFSQNEIGYKVIRQSHGRYSGKVKWRNTSGGESWKEVNISIVNNTYADTGSDACSKEMKRVHID